MYRFHIVQEFNKGVYDYIIASDESVLRGGQSEDEENDDTEGEEELLNDNDDSGIVEDGETTSLDAGDYKPH